MMCLNLIQRCGIFFFHSGPLCIVELLRGVGVWVCVCLCVYGRRGDINKRDFRMVISLEEVIFIIVTSLVIQAHLHSINTSKPLRMEENKEGEKGKRGETGRGAKITHQS